MQRCWYLLQHAYGSGSPDGSRYRMKNETPKADALLSFGIWLMKLGLGITLLFLGLVGLAVTVPILLAVIGAI